ncbi:class I SAM-dependent methyltransferase [Streptomyces virginiae]|uniref:class I SAM-dependent methyltransferase n=1 Tax=Streptomyces virginiae TaxID=1961 RepID=UPI00367B681E
MSSQIDEVIRTWETADPVLLHPLRAMSEDAYRISGQNHAALLSTVVPPGTVVDFGCGDGRVAIPLDDLGYDVIAVDGAQAMLDRLAAAAPDLPSARSDGTDLAAVLGEPADSLIAIGVLGQYDDAVAAQLVEKMRAAVRPDGILVLDWPGSERHVDLCRRIGLEALPLGLPWSAYRATDASA